MKRPSGISLEIGRDDLGWFVYIGKQKHLHIRPTRHKADPGYYFSMSALGKDKEYNHRNWINARYGGIKFDIGIGKHRRPFPKAYKLTFWPKVWAWWHGKHITTEEEYMIKEPNTNPWNSGNQWFVLFPKWFLPLPYFFMSVCYGAGKRQPGLYAGFRGYRVDWLSRGKGIYKNDPANKPWEWLNKEPYPEKVSWGDPDESGNIYLAMSASMRLSDMVDG